MPTNIHQDPAANVPPVVLCDQYGNVCTLSGGTLAVIAEGSASLPFSQGLNVANTAFSSLGGVMNSLPIVKYLTTPPTMTNAQYNALLADINAFLLTTLGTLLAGENQTDNRLMTENAWTSLSIPTQTTTTVKSGLGKLGYIIIPTQVASATVKVYDSLAASGTVLMDTLTMPATLLNEGPFTLWFGGTTFTTGLTIITAGATMPIDVGYL